MPFLRVIRDKRGYETTYLMHLYREGPRQRSRILYVFRTPGDVRVGRSSLEPETLRQIEKQNPAIEFDWTVVIGNQQVVESAPDLRRPRRRQQDEAETIVEAPAPARAPEVSSHAAAPPPLPEIADAPAPRSAIPERIQGDTPDEKIGFLVYWYGVCRERILQRTSDADRHEGLLALAERLNPATWTDADQITAGLLQAAEALERLSHVFGKRRRRPRRSSGRVPGQSDPARTGADVPEGEPHIGPPGFSSGDVLELPSGGDLEPAEVNASLAQPAQTSQVPDARQSPDDLTSGDRGTSEPKDPGDPRSVRHRARSSRFIMGWLEAIILRLGHLGPWGPLLFILLYVVSAVTLAPSFLLTVAGGAVFGVWRGSILVFIGAVAGASSAYAIALRLAGSRMLAWLDREPRVAVVRAVVAQEGVWVQFLLRLSPVVPFTLLNYALGLSRVRFRDFVIALTGMIPAIVMYTYYGKVVGDVTAIAAGVAPPRGRAYYVLLTVGLVATVVATTIITRAARRAIEQQRADGPRAIGDS